MKIEDEAKAFTDAKKKIFINTLENQIKEIKQLISDNLWESQEKEEALLKFTEAVLWTKHTADMHGIK